MKLFSLVIASALLMASNVAAAPNPVALAVRPASLCLVTSLSLV